MEILNFLRATLIVLLVAASLSFHVRLFAEVYLYRAGKIVADYFALGDALLAGILVLFFIGTTSANFAATQQQTETDPNINLGIFLTLVQWVIIIGAILFSMAYRGINIVSVFGLNKLPFSRVALYGAGLLFSSLPVIYAGSELWTIVLKAYHYNIGPEQIVQTFVNAGGLDKQIPMILLAVLIAPLTEEFVFRGYIYGTLKRYCGPLASLFFSGVLFALVHVSVSSLLPLFLLGCIFTIAYEKTGSLFVSVTMHALFNAINIVALLIPQQ